MSFHLLAYNGSATASVSNLALAGLADPEFTRQGAGNSYRFSEPYKLLINLAMGTHITDMRLNMPTINAIARHHVRPLNQSATIPSNPQVQDLRDYPMDLPLYEDMVWETSKEATSETVTHTVLNWLAPTDWNRNLPRGQQRTVLRATGAVAGVAGVWSSLGSLTFAENLRNGWYAIVGAQCFDAGSLAFRFNFAKPSITNGRKMRPGGVCEEAIGNIPLALQMSGLGEWGRFHSNEPPQLEILANATAASAQVLDMDVVYLGSGSP